MEADFGFTGFYRHQASGLNQTLYRAYDPELGRWLSRDPLAERGGLNLYAYVGNDPVNAIDLLGLAIDVNLFADEMHKGVNFFRAGEYIDSPSDSLLTVGGHGNKDGVFADHASYQGPVPIKDLADIIRNTDKWKKGQVKTVRLISCNVGNGKYPQKLADELGVEVQAPNTYAWYSEGGDHANGNDMLYPETFFLKKKNLNHPGRYISSSPTPKK
jgi:RHS repeat-associated protein